MFGIRFLSLLTAILSFGVRSHSRVEAEKQEQLIKLDCIDFSGGKGGQTRNDLHCEVLCSSCFTLQSSFTETEDFVRGFISNKACLNRIPIYKQE